MAPLLVVATTRPEFRPAWGVRSHHVTISLAPLDRQQVREMVAELSARHALAKEVVEDVAARTGGVPLFIEEVTRLLLERGEQGGIQAIPPTLQQSLMRGPSVSAPWESSAKRRRACAASFGRLANPEPHQSHSPFAPKWPGPWQSTFRLQT